MNVADGPSKLGIGKATQHSGVWKCRGFAPQRFDKQDLQKPRQNEVTSSPGVGRFITYVSDEVAETGSDSLFSADMDKRGQQL